MKRQRWWWLAAVVAALLLLAMSPSWRHWAWRLAADFQHPFQAAGEAVRDVAVDRTLLLKPKTELVRSLTRLQDENEVLRARLAVADNLLQENAQLRHLLALSPRLAYRVVCAEVRGRDPLFWRERLMVNKGRDDGVIPGAVVLCSLLEGDDEAGGFAVVGRVVEAARHSAQVATLLNPQCRISAMLVESQGCGLLQGVGDGAGPARSWVRLLARDIELRPGEMVVTSGYSELTPPGLLLGWLAGRSDGSPEARVINHLHQEAACQVAADLSRIRTLLILSPLGSKPGND